MNKVLLSLFLSFVGVTIVNAKTINVEFSDCVDGDTAKFIYKDEVITARFLAIDTPETVHPTKDVEKYGKEASDYTCNKLKKATKIKLEYDDNSDETDKYDRHLVWVFIDGELLQEDLVNKGLASVAYLYDDYKYTNILEEAEQIAEDNHIGIWSINESDNENKTLTFEQILDKYKEEIIIICIVIIICIFNVKARKKVKNKVKNKIKNEIDKRF